MTVSETSVSTLREIFSSILSGNIIHYKGSNFVEKLLYPLRVVCEENKDQVASSFGASNFFESLRRSASGLS